MSAIAVAGPGLGRGRRLRWGSAAVVIVSVLAAAAFVVLLMDRAVPSPQFQGACERLRSVGLAITPADTFCNPTPWSAQVAHAVALALIATGLVMPCAILAATGRRLTAVAPLLAAPALTLDGVLVRERWAGAWLHGSTATDVATGLVLLAPVVAVMLTRRGSDRIRRRTVPLVVCAATWLLLCIPIAGVVWLAHDAYVRHYRELGGTLGPAGIVVPFAISIALFGALLGTDRRWWPWSLVPVALLLSTGPSIAMIDGWERVQDWSRFGAVVPLFAVGMIASAWRPLAERLTVRLRPDAALSVDRPPARALIASHPRHLRPTTVLNAVGAGLLIISLVMFRADPLPAQIGTSLPTYLGVRTSASDLRARQLLHRALADMDAYRAAHGSYRGFDAAAAAEVDPEVSWRTGVPRPTEGGPIPELTMGIVTASDATARVLTVSSSGNAICIQRDAGGTAYGVGSRVADHVSSGGVVRDALAACGSVPWTAAALRPLPVTTMCRGLEQSSGYLICRMVQVVMLKELAATGPA